MPGLRLVCGGLEWKIGGYGRLGILRGRGSVGEATVRRIGIAAEWRLLQAVARGHTKLAARRGDGAGWLPGERVCVGIPDEFELAIIFCFLEPQE